MFVIIKKSSDLFLKFLLIRLAKLEDGSLTIRGNLKDIQDTDDNAALRTIWRNAIDITYGKIKTQYEPDNQAAEATKIDAHNFS